MSKEMERLNIALAAVREKTDFVPEVAVVLGSGLGGFADEISQVAIVDYKDIPGMPVSTAPGHVGRFVFGYVEETPVVVMQGRVHFYEGYDPRDIVMPIRLMGLLGARGIFLTNASGGIRRDLVAGTLMLITDQISCLVPSPLRGENPEELGPRFPDMTDIYDLRLRDILRNAARQNGILLPEGVYIQTSGPNYESPAEIRMYERWGADAVGMSTTGEAIAARHMGMRVCGVSCVANLSAGLSATPLTGEEVIEVAGRTAPVFKKLMWTALAAMHGEFQEA